MSPSCLRGFVPVNESGHQIGYIVLGLLGGTTLYSVGMITEGGHQIDHVVLCRLYSLAGYYSHICFFQMLVL